MELSSRLVTESWPWASSNKSDHGSVIGDGDPASPSPSPVVGAVDAGGKAMLGLVVARAADTAPTVRRGRILLLLLLLWLWLLSRKS